MGNVIGVPPRVEVQDLAEAVDFHRALAGAREVRRSSSGAVDPAWVGPFLLLAGPAAASERVRRVATVLVVDVEQVAAAVVDVGGQVLEGPAAGPDGARSVARHADGSVFEHIQPSDA